MELGADLMWQMVFFHVSVPNGKLGEKREDTKTVTEQIKTKI